MSKPIGCTFPDCFICPLDDCIYDREEQIATELEEVQRLLNNIRATASSPLRQQPLYKKLMNKKNYLERKLDGGIDEERH